MFNSLHITSLDFFWPSNAWVGVQSSTTSVTLHVTFGSIFTCKFTSIIHINLWICDSNWNRKKLCNKQEIMKHLAQKKTCSSVLVRNSLNVFLRMPKAFSTTQQPLLCFLLYINSKTMWWSSYLNGVMIHVIKR
jgi:hypothetical protein